MDFQIFVKKRDLDIFFIRFPFVWAKFWNLALMRNLGLEASLRISGRISGRMSSRMSGRISSRMSGRISGWILSMDIIHGYYPWILSMDDIHG